MTNTTSQTETNWIELAKVAQQSIFNRRDLEWKLSFGFWAAIAAFTSAFFTGKISAIAPNTSCCLAVAYLLLFVLTIPFWHLPIQKAHGGDKKYYFYYLQRARGISDVDANFKEGKGAWANVDKAWFFGHLVFTAFFLAASWCLITQIAIPSIETEQKAKEAHVLH